MSLRKQTQSGLLWTFIDTFFLKGVSFIASLILARLLGPRDFGLIGMISIFVGIGATLVDSGLSSSLIRNKQSDEGDYSTVFYLNLIISVVVYLAIFFLAPYIAEFYKEIILTNIIRLYCLSFIISAFSAVQSAVLIRSMEFKKIMTLNIPGTLAGVVVGLILGYLGYGVWSIVWMYLTTQATQSLSLWAFSNWKPKFIFSREKMKYHFNFGYKLTLSALLNTAFNNIYNVIIGKFYSVQALGFFDRANTLNQYPVVILTGIFGKVTYPLLSNIQDQKERIGQVYRKLLQIIFFITAPIMMAGVAIAKPLFLLVLGERWLSAVTFFQILSLASIFYPIHAYNINILKVYGRSDLFLKLEMIKKVLVFICIGISLPFGINGLVWSSVLVSFFGLIINTYYSESMIDYTTKNQLLDMLPVFLISTVMAALMYVLVYLLSNFALIFQVVVPVICGFGFYFGINFIFKIKPFVYSLELVKNRNRL